MSISNAADSKDFTGTGIHHKSNILHSAASIVEEVAQVVLSTHNLKHWKKKWQFPATVRRHFFSQVDHAWSTVSLTPGDKTRGSNSSKKAPDLGIQLRVPDLFHNTSIIALDLKEFKATEREQHIDRKVWGYSMGLGQPRNKHPERMRFHLRSMKRDINQIPFFKWLTFTLLQFAPLICCFHHRFSHVWRTF